ncbi:MAG: hypothetical protein U0271_33860 [Polyangiaceae bacterium]
MPVAHTRSRWRARVVRELDLFYSAPHAADADLDPWVRSASGAVFFRGELALAQDDAAAVAFVDVASGTARAVLLPAGPGGRRRFDDELGNKHDKHDWEAVCVLELAGAPELVLFGSGSADARNVAMIVERTERGPSRLVDLTQLYAVLRAAPALGGGELNVEGVHASDASMFFVCRGNGLLPSGERVPNLLFEIALADFSAFVEGGPVPALHSVRALDLGALGPADRPVPLSITDVTRWRAPGALLFAAAAEDSPDATRDGVVLGSVLAVLAGDTLEVIDVPTSHPVKIEGVTLDPQRPDHVFAVTDPDNPHAPAKLLEIELTVAD